MCPFTFLLQYLVYFFFYCFQKRSLILKNTSAKPSIPLGLSMVSRASCIMGEGFFSKNKTYHRCQERRGKFNKNALY